MRNVIRISWIATLISPCLAVARPVQVNVFLLSDRMVHLRCEPRRQYRLKHEIKIKEEIKTRTRQIFILHPVTLQHF